LSETGYIITQMAIQYNKGCSPTNTTGGKTNVIKGGYQEVSPSPPPAPEHGGSWGTAVPATQPQTQSGVGKKPTDK